jgi:hypothetical protein
MAYPTVTPLMSYRSKSRGQQNIAPLALRRKYIREARNRWLVAREVPAATNVGDGSKFTRQAGEYPPAIDNRLF